MNPRQNPYDPPSSGAPVKSPNADRLRRGFVEGAGWGAAIGLIRGAVETFRGSATWYLPIGGSMFAGILVGGLVFAIGRAISGRLFGAWMGFAFGLFIGLMIGNAVGGHHWTTITDSNGSVTAVTAPVAQMAGAGLGAFVGLIVGAISDRVIRGVASSHSS